MPIESGIAMVHIIRTPRTYRNLLRHKGNRAGRGVAWARGSGAIACDLARRLVPLSPPNSGLPEFGKHGAQVGQARPAWRGLG